MHLKLHGSMLSLLLLLGACGDDLITTTGAESVTTDEPATGSATGDTAPPTTTIDEPPTTGEPPDGSSTTTGDGTTGDGTTGDTTTEGDTTEGDTTGSVEPDPDLVIACEAYCQRWDECGLQPDVAACVAGCSDSLLGVTGECEAANQAALACKTALSCADLLATLDDVEGGPCGEESAAVAAACDGGDCGQSVFEAGDTCELSLECPEAPLQEMKCDAQTCTCYEDGEQVGQCAAEGVCSEGDAIFDKAASCCRFS